MKNRGRFAIGSTDPLIACILYEFVYNWNKTENVAMNSLDYQKCWEKQWKKDKTESKEN